MNKFVPHTVPVSVNDEYSKVTALFTRMALGHTPAIHLCSQGLRALFEKMAEGPGDFVKELKKQAESVQHGEYGDQSKKEYVDADGTVFEWDAERHGWFPKVLEVICLSLWNRNVHNWLLGG